MKDTSDPWVTIITPTYNRASYLEETIDSILGQDYPHIDYLVLDDGSTDNTRELLQRYEGRLRWQSHPNMGEHRTVNKGFSLARGKYVAVVNSDDPLRPEAIRAAVGILEARPELLVAYPDWDMVDSSNRVVRTVCVPEYDYRQMVEYHQCLVGPGAVIRRVAIERVRGRNPEYRFVADLDFWLRVGLLGPMAKVPAALATWRTHGGSATHEQRGRAMAAEHIKVIDTFFGRRDLPRDIQRLRRRAMSWAHYTAALCAGDLRWLRLRHVLMFLIYNPTNVRAWWKKTGREKPQMNRFKLAFSRLFAGADRCELAGQGNGEGSSR